MLNSKKTAGVSDTEETFYIVYAYACLYKADTKHVDEVKADEITINFVCQKRPRKLLKHLKKHRGIYTEGKYQRSRNSEEDYREIRKSFDKQFV